MCLPAHAGRRLRQDAADAYVEAQIAIVTSGNMATSLQMQLNQTILEPQRLLTALQQTGLAVTDITLQSLDVEEVGLKVMVLGGACSLFRLLPVSLILRILSKRLHHSCTCLVMSATRSSQIMSTFVIQCHGCMLSGSA